MVPVLARISNRQVPQKGAISPAKDLPRFTGLFSGKDNFDELDKQVASTLSAAGFTRKKLMKDWGVTLWRIAAIPNKKVLLWVDPGENTPEKLQPLFESLKKPLAKFGELVIHLKTMALNCCQGCCRGCASSPSSKHHREWVG